MKTNQKGTVSGPDSFITRLTHGDVNEANLTESQKHATDGKFAFVMANFIEYIHDRLDDLEQYLPTQLIRLRDSFEFSHGRTNTQVAHLLIGLQLALDFALDNKAVTEKEARELHAQYKATLLAVAEKQGMHQQESDPANSLP